MHENRALQRTTISQGTHRVRVAGLKVDSIDRPLGLGNPLPSLSWRLESTERNVRQSAYRILVANNEAALAAGRGDLWDSGRVNSPHCLSIPYGGEPLHSRQRCCWRVQIWDEAGTAAEPSAPSWWEMGFLSPTDWVAQWLAVDDAIARQDRETPLQWMWGHVNENAEKETRRFQLTFSLQRDTKGGVFFALGRSFEKLTGVWLDGVPITLMYPGHDPTRESVSVGPLAPGEHELVIDVRHTDPLPERYFEPPPPGVAVFARFDSDDGETVRVVSGENWQTCVDDKAWHPVVTSLLSRNVIVDPAMHLRRVFSIEKSVASARLYATALGCYEARLNGGRVGDALLTPELSQYEKRVLYRVYDVRHLLRRGANALGFTVGDGWYASHPGRYAWGPPPRRLIAQLELTYTDGTKDVIATGTGWRIARSAIQQCELCVGEIYDARLEQPGWDTADFDDSKWLATQLAESPPGRLAAQTSPPIRATEVLNARSITTPLPGVYVFDFGQNFAGWCRLRVSGPAGTRVDLRFAEQITPSGEIDQFSLYGGKAVDTYILSGDADPEIFEPHFTYHGFRYVQVTGLLTKPAPETLEGIVIHSDLQITGNLRVDHPMIKQLWRNILWTQRSNCVGIATDLPGRAERMSYFGDNGVIWDCASFNMDLAAFTRRHMDNARDHQYARGALPPLAPAPDDFAIYHTRDDTASPGWADGGITLPWVSWRHYADRQVIEQNWEAMSRYLQFILDRNPNYLWLNGRGPDLGDWLAIGDNHFMRPKTPPSTPMALIATAYWAHSAGLLAQMADALDKNGEAKQLRAVREHVRSAFIKEFVQPDGRVGNGSQCSYILALKFRLVPDELRPSAVEHLVSNIRSGGTALTTGFLGTQFSLDVLAEAGYQEVAYDLLLRTKYPSWGYMIEHGATTIWERWDGSLDKHYAMASQNQFASGSVGAFLFRRLAGIEDADAGFRKIRVRPYPNLRVKRAGGDYDSVMGRISTNWELTDNGGLSLEVTLPANTTAYVHLPARRCSRIEESGQAISHHDGLRIVSRSEQEAIVEVGSGTYRFLVTQF